MDLRNRARISATDGLLTWRPDLTVAGTTHLFSVILTDNGTPSLSATQSSKVAVEHFVALGLDNLAAPVGTSSSVPVTLFSTAGLTNLDFTVRFPEGRLTNMSLTPLPGIELAGNPSNSISGARFAIAPAPGQRLQGTQQVAQLSATVLRL